MVMLLTELEIEWTTFHLLKEISFMQMEGILLHLGKKLHSRLKGKYKSMLE